MEGHPKLRVCFLLDSEKTPNWILYAIKTVSESNFAEVPLIIRVERRGKENPSLLYRLYKKFDDSNFRPEPNALGCDEDIPQVPRIEMSVSEQAEELKQRFDVLVSSCSIDPSLQQIATFCIYPDGDSAEGFWEVMGQRPVTDVSISIRDVGRGITRRMSSSLATDPISVNRNRNNLLWKRAALIIRSVKALAEGRFESIHENEMQEQPPRRSIASCMLGLFASTLSRKMQYRSSFDQWVLIYGKSSFPLGPLAKFDRILPPKDRFWADPHVVTDNKDYVFIEECAYGKKGHISVMTVENGKHTQPRTVLERPYHLSYPFVFKFDGTYFMIPETMENGTIEAYKCTRFPDSWEFHKILMKGVRAVDATLFYHNSKWWLFAAMSEYKGESTWDELFLFYSDNPLSENWIPHPKNPIVSGVQRARPAGNIFESGGSIIRPSQDSSHGYGYGISLNKILALTESDYKEEQIGAIRPDWDKNVIGIHTVSLGRDIAVLDVKRRTPK